MAGDNRAAEVPISQTPPCNKTDNSNEDMEAIAAVSSVTAIIQFSAVIFRATADIVHRFKDAPEELSDLARQLNILQSELSFINSLREEADGDSLALLPDEIQNFSDALEEILALIREFQIACNKHNHRGKPSKSSRLSWVFQDQAKMKSMSARLRQAQSSLNNILQLINIRITSLSRRHIIADSALAKTAHLTLIRDVNTIRRNVERDTQRGKIPENMVLNGLVTRNPHDGNKFWQSVVCLEESWLNYLGLQAALSWYGNDYQTTFNLSTRYRILGSRLLCADLRVRRFPIAGLGFQFVAGGIGIKNVVPEDSKIMKACKDGDLTTVHQLFASRQASPNDVTPENSSPLRYAIENGSEAVVKTILASGADANAPFGQFMTSPLEWAFASRKINIARILVEQGARVDHISAKGWTPAFNLFGYDYLHNTKESCREYLELLSAKGFSEFDIKDVAGWSAIHGAAAYGTADDISALVERGSSVSLLTIMYWKPIRCALVFGNVETFLELAKHMQPSFVDDQDIRGWTLLHQAADRGSSIMLDLVLSYGADPHILSLATSYGVPESLEGRILSAADVAQAKSSEAFEVYVKALKKAGFDFTMDSDLSDDSLSDVFWEAGSTISEDEKHDPLLSGIS